MANEPNAGGARSALNITAPTVIKSSPGVLVRVVIVTAPSANGGIYDWASTTGLAATNKIDTISSSGAGAGQDYVLDWPCKVGITVDPGTGGVVSVSYI
jgi:hypothetical protein